MTMRSVVVANAGSGKTYLLANRLIRWLIEERRRALVADPVAGRAAPERVLATTFTRKAAGEIFERLLLHLARGALDAQARASFASPEHVGDAEAGEYLAVLEEVVRSLHRVSIGTIDGFFLKLASAFSRELGLPESWTIADEEMRERVREAAVGAVISQDHARARRIAKAVSSGEPKATVHAELEANFNSAIGLWERCLLAADPNAAWQAILRPGVVRVPGAHRLDPAERAAALQRLMIAPLPLTKSGSPNKFWERARANVKALVEADLGIDLLNEMLVVNAINGDQFSRLDFPPPMREALVELAGHARAEFDEQIQQRQTGMHEMVALVHDALERERAARGAYGFGEVTSALARARAGSGTGADSMRQRLDRNIQDLALDEFQDTSPAQYAVLSGLIDEILASPQRRLLAVGDPKQSIYGWRDGTPSLLRALGARGGMEPDAPLATSFRSSPVVLEVVNELFSSLQPRLAQAGLDPAFPGTRELFDAAGLASSAEVDEGIFSRALAQWTFVEHRSAPALAHLPGVVQVFRAADDSSESAARRVAEVVAARRANRPKATIGVLMRGNKEVAACVAALRDAGLQVSDEGRSPLLDSPAVAVVLALLRVADHPGDRISLYLVTREPARELLKLPAMEAFGVGQEQHVRAAEVSQQIRAELQQLGMSAWIARQAQALAPACAQRDLLRLQQLAVMAAKATPEMIDRPAAFVRFVEREASRIGTADAIRVMTLHTSKGLEFDEVVLGSMDEAMGALNAARTRWAALTPDPTQPPAAVVPVFAKELMQHSPLLEAVAREAALLKLLDDLSCFYVGVTRAKSALHMICAPLPAKGAPQRISPTRLLQLAYPDFDQALQEPAPVEGAIWSHGDVGALDATAAASTTEGEATGVEGLHRAPELTLVARAGARMSAAAAPSAHRNTADAQWKERVTGGDGGERGLVAHAWCQRLEWLDGTFPMPADTAAVRIAAMMDFKGPIDEVLVEQTRLLVANACNGPLAAWLRPARYQGWNCQELRLRTEMSFLAPMDSGLQRGRMDRVVLGVRDGRIVRAEILDWKTGAEHAQGADLQTRLDGYRRQIDEYRAALALLLRIEPSAVGATLLMLDRGEAIECFKSDK